MALNNYQDADFTPSIEPSDNRPSMGTYNTPQTFRFWCQKVLPLVYDDSLSYYELLCKVVDYLNKTMEDVNTAVEDVTNLNSAFGSLENHVNASETALLQAYNDLQSYVNTYFNNLDVQEEINNKLDAMVADGTLDAILLPYFNEYTEATNELINGRFRTQDNKISVLEGRMDAFSSLPDGSLSTAADAELVDIRVGADDTTYSTAGDAVRGQFNWLKTALGANALLTGWVQGGINVNTGADHSYDTRIKTLIPLKSDAELLYAGTNYYIDAYCWVSRRFVGGWTGSACATGADYKHKVINLKKLIKTINPSKICLVVQNKTNTVLDQDDAKNNIFAFTSYYVDEGEYQDEIANIEDIITYKDQTAWIQGGINANTGASVNITYRIKRTIDLKNVAFIRTNEGYEFGIFAYSGNEYIGTWNGTTFEKTEHWIYGVNKDDINNMLNENYTYWIVGGNTTTTAVTPSDGEQIPIYINFVNEIKSTTDASLHDITNEIWVTETPTWVQGGIHAVTGASLNITYRIKTTLNNYITKITANNGFNFGIFAFSGSEYIGMWNETTFEKVEHWIQGTLDTTFLQNYAYDYWIAAGYVNNASLTPEAGTNYTLEYSRITKIENAQEENMNSFSVCPNIIFQCRNVDDTSIPPNSKWYIKAAADNQYDRVRCDVRKTTDGYYFLCHDDNINNVARNMDGSVISETISASGRTLAELNQYDWGIKYGQQYAGMTVPLLEDFLKYAAMFNLGVTWHSGSTDCETAASITEQFDLIDKYGLTDNIIVVTASGQNLVGMRTIKQRNPRISYYVGGLPEFFTTTIINNIKELQTPYNKIYVQLFPWGTAPTDSFIQLAKSNNFLLYDSITMDKNTLLDENMFNKGYSLREVNNVTMVKNTVRKWANSLV